MVHIIFETRPIHFLTDERCSVTIFKSMPNLTGSRQYRGYDWRLLTMDRISIFDSAGIAAYTRGQELYRNHQVFRVQVGPHEWDEDIDEISGIVRDNNTSYEVEFSYDTTLGEIEYEDCACPGFARHFETCPHLVALMLYYVDHVLTEGIREYDSELDSELYASEDDGQLAFSPAPASVITSAGMRRLLLSADLNQPIALPELSAKKEEFQKKLHIWVSLSGEWSYESGITLSFKLGNKRPYVLKDVYTFVDDVMYERNHRYGNQLEFEHKIEYFDEESQRIIHFLMGYVKRNPRYNYGYYHYYYKGASGKELVLDNEELEEFIKACDVGTEIDVDILEVESGSYVITDGAPPRELRIRGTEGGIELQTVLHTGMHGNYYEITLCNGKLYREELDSIRTLKPFLNVIAENRGKYLTIAQVDVPAFCRGLLPTIKDYFEITYKDFDASQYAVEKPELHIYLDAPQKGYVTARVLAIYGDREYNIYSPQDISARNMAIEREAANGISPLFNAFDNNQMELVIAEDDELIYRLLREGVDELKRWGEVFISDKLRRFGVRKPGAINVGISIDGGLLDFSMKESTLSMEQLAEILSRYDRKKKFYRLKNGEFVDLTEMTNIEQTAELLNQLGITERQLKFGSVRLDKYRALYLDSFERDEDFYIEKTDQFVQLIADMKDFDGRDYSIPRPQSRILRDYQRTGYKWIRTLSELGFGGILADDMGLGKTLQMITYLQAIYDEGERKPALIVCPASLVYNWGSEIDKFGNGLSYELMVMDARSRGECLASDLSGKIIVTSYDLLRRDIELYERIEFFCQILDEAQYIKNQNTQMARAVKGINSTVRFALTGTPIENRVSELWSIFDYLMPGFLYSYQRFHGEYEQPIVIHSDKDVTKKLRTMIRPFILRRLKQDVLKDLPDKLEKNYICRMTGEQRELYNAHVERLKLLLGRQTEEEFKKGKIEVLAELTKLRQLCCDPALLYEKYEDGSIKTQMCMDLIAEAIEGEHKILVFSQFTSMLDILTRQLQKNKIKYHLLTGQTPKAVRAKMVESFETDDTNVFCISLKAGGTGLNLTAADIVIHFDPWWNVAAQNQATDRTHRIGQKNVVTVYRLVTQNTIEERIIELQNNKQRLADSLLCGEDFASGSFTKEELLQILQS